jgi:hypothetical protein
MNMTFVVQFNVYVCLIEVDRYISHTEDMFLDIHFRINDWKMFRCLHNAKICFCALNELLQNLWILSFQCENDDFVYAGLAIGLQSMRQIVWCILIDVLLGPFHPAGVPFSVVIMDHYQASHWNICIIPS